MRLTRASRSARREACSGRMSNVPRGALIAAARPPSGRRSVGGKLAKERVGGALAAERGYTHVTGIYGRLGGKRVDQRFDRREQRRPVPAGQVDAPDRALKEDVAGKKRPFVAERVGHVTGTVARGEDHFEPQPSQVKLLTAPH